MKIQRKIKLGVVAALAVPALIVIVFLSRGGAKPAPAPVETALVTRGELKLSVEAKGQFQAERSVAVNPEISGNATLTFLVAEGTTVTSGEIIARFSTDDVEREIADWEMRVTNNRNSLAQADESLKMTASSNETDLAAARLRYQMAVLDEQQYGTVLLGPDGRLDEAAYAGGLAPDRGDVYRQFRDAALEITRADNTLERAVADLDGMDKLWENQFVPRKDYLAAQIAEIEARRNLEKRNLAFQLLKDFTYPQTRSQKEAAVAEARNNLAKAEITASVKLNQAESSARSSLIQYGRATERLNRVLQELERRTVSAPVNGIVLYGDPTQQGRGGRGGGGGQIAVGQTLWRGSRLFTMPDISSIVVQTRVLEMDIYTVAVGCEVEISIDAIPGLAMTGRVSRIAEHASVAGGGFSSRGARTFEIMIRVDGTDERIKPGMSCTAEIIADRVPNALYVPLTSVFTKGGVKLCYVAANGAQVPVEVTTGRSSDKFVEILSGLEAGQRVVVADTAPAENNTNDNRGR